MGAVVRLAHACYLLLVRFKNREHPLPPRTENETRMLLGPNNNYFLWKIKMANLCEEVNLEEVKDRVIKIRRTFSEANLKASKILQKYLAFENFKKSSITEIRSTYFTL